MQEQKTPKKPFIYYYCIVLIGILLFNLFFMPMMSESKVEKVDYGTFLTMLGDGKIDTVELNDSATTIAYTTKEDGGKTI